MSTYSMAQVEALTGIKGHTIRIWERRYSFLEPGRTSTNIRYYDDDQLRKLLNISILNRNGYKISKIDKMSESEINDKVYEIFNHTSADISNEVNKLTLSMLELNEIEFEAIFQKLLVRYGLMKTITEIIYPFLDHVGVLWSTHKAMPAQEHFVSNLIRQKIISAIDSLPIPTKDAPSILLFLCADENHEIGLLLASFIAREMGWRVYYLGQNVPQENVIEVYKLKEPKFLLTMLVSPLTSKYKEKIEAISKAVTVPLLASGSRNNIQKLSEQLENVMLLISPDQLIEQLQ